MNPFHISATKFTKEQRRILSTKEINSDESVITSRTREPPCAPCFVSRSKLFRKGLHCMSTLFQQAAEHIKCLHKKETWHIEFDTKHSGITQLPSEFENKVQEVVQMVKESVLLGGHRESPLLDNANAQRELNALIQGLLLSFTQERRTECVCGKGEVDVEGWRGRYGTRKRIRGNEEELEREEFNKAVERGHHETREVALDTLAFSNDGMQNESSAVSQLIEITCYL
ncbi:unnamed protein product [Timema podura]|uniref:Exocyst complex component EXOC2/Sec5 N-terminal domain-containing protein n=1 Tax=Timema podura TaxID=61482 RepID=A0ABN7NUS8_TIMPD|nr:unnamed protein product [Timema podura]